MDAELVTIGTELLLGQIVDTNATWIAQRLADAGINLYFKTTVGDNRRRAAEVIENALNRVDVVLTTGGLGPTVDDMTREAIADAVGRELVRDEELVAHIREIFLRWGREAGENNLRQANLPEGAVVLPNPIGTAPGFRVEHDGKHVIAMPGVPREMKRMMEEQVLPFLRERAGDDVVIKVRVLHTIAIGESSVDDRIADLMTSSNPTIGLGAHTGQVDVRITARAPGDHEADMMIAQLEHTVRSRLGDYIYGADEDTIESVIADMLAARGERLALVETNTGGQIASRLEQYDASVLACSEVQSAVQPQENETRDSAERVRKSAGTAWGLVIHGTAGADEGTYGENQGETVVAVAGPDGVTSRSYHIGGQDEHSLGWIANRSLNLLRRQLLECE